MRSVGEGVHVGVKVWLRFEVGGGRKNRQPTGIYSVWNCFSMQ